MTKRSGKVLNVGRLINKLENEMALATMRGDKQAEQEAHRKLEQAINMTSFRHYSA